MAIFPHTLCLSSTFVCEREEQASVREKRNNLHTPRPWNSRPHIRVEAYVGSHPTALNRVNVYHYKGHTPDAPVLLGADRTGAYRAAAVATDWGGGRGQAIAGAAAVGAVLGVIGAGISLGFLALLLAAGVHGALTVSSSLLLVVLDALVVAALLAYVELRDYQGAHQRFLDLAQLSDGFERLTRREANEAVELACQRLVEKGYGGREWALRHAAAEYDQEMQADLARRAPAQAAA